MFSCQQVSCNEWIDSLDETNNLLAYRRGGANQRFAVVRQGADCVRERGGREHRSLRESRGMGVQT
jgi:hypothetical protein